MNNDIKEILDKCTPFLFGDEVDKLLDYITNLQEENRQTKLLKDRYQLEKEDYKLRITNLQEENERLKREKIQKELCESLLDECDEHNKYLQQRIDKAIEYNNHLIRDAKYYLNLGHLKKMNKILEGDDK